MHRTYTSNYTRLILTADIIAMISKNCFIVLLCIF